MNFPRVLVACFLIIGLTMFATPTESRAQLGVGFIGGANFSSLNAIRANGNLVSFENASAYHLGMFLDINIGPVGLRPSILYLNTGPLFKGATFLRQDDFDLSYMSMPIDLIFYMGVGPVKPYLFAGPEFLFLGSNDAPEDLEEDLKTSVSSFSMGFGISISFPGAGFKLYPQLRYSFGISELTRAAYQVEGIPIETTGNSKVNSWLLSLGVRF